MKPLSYILFFILLLLGSCTSSLYTGVEYDDLYYLPSDKPVIQDNRAVNEQVVTGSLQAEDYFDNVYAADTLVSEQYINASDYDDEIIIDNNNYGGAFNYNDAYSYSGRISMFHGNYFNPYWRDPFYYGYGPSFGFNYGFGYGPSLGFSYGFGGYPYYPYYYPDYYYGGYGYGYGYGYSPYYGYPYYGGYYGGYYPHYGSDSYVSYGRRERPSTVSSRWNSSAYASGSSRRNSNISTGDNARSSARSNASGTNSALAGQRRTNSSVSSLDRSNSSISGRTLTQDQVKGENAVSRSATQRSSADAKPAYNSSNRTYTPSYNNPRLSTRPSYNNSRVYDGTNSGVNRNSGSFNNSRTINNSSTVRTQPSQGSYQNREGVIRSNSSNSGNMQRRSVSTPSSSRQYSVPTRRSAESGRSYSSGSYNNSSSVGRSSGSGSGGSYSSGSSSGSSSRSSSGSSSGSSSRSSSSRR